MGQIIYSGFGSLKKLDTILESYKPKRIFLVTGWNSFKLSGAKELLKKILNKYNIIQFNNFETNPKIYDILKGIQIFNNSKCDVIIAVGGGSVMDMAKAISILSIQTKDLKKIILNGSYLLDRKIPTVMIPTTAGSGSESTSFVVIYINKIKYSLEHHSILPDYAILDPILTENLPSYITACTGMDALCKAIESFWSVKSTKESRKYSKQAIELILPNIAQAVNNPNHKSREKMLKGSNLAGKAINIAQTTAAHSISYPITSYFNVPHGHAVSLILPYFLEFNYDINSGNIQDSRGIDFVKDRLHELFKILRVKTPKEAKKKIIEIMKEMKMKTKLSDFGINNNNFKIIIKYAFNIQRMSNNPKIVLKSDLKKLLEKIK